VDAELFEDYVWPATQGKGFGKRSAAGDAFSRDLDFDLGTTDENVDKESTRRVSSLR